MSVSDVDIFISHASEDSDFARRLAEMLRAKGLVVWFDEVDIRIGDSLTRSIDQGLVSAKHGVVVLSRAFFKKQWAQGELQSLTSRQMAGEVRIVPIWHGVSVDEVRQFSPPLADIKALDASSLTPEQIADALERVV